MPRKGQLTPEQIMLRREASLRWYHKNKDRVSERRLNPEMAERQREYTRAYRARNREELNERSRVAQKLRRAESPEVNKAACAKYREVSRDQTKAQRRDRWANDAAFRATNNAKRREHWESQNPDKRSAAALVRSISHREREPWSRLLRSAEGRAVKKGIPFELTKAWAEARWTGFCEVSGIPFVVKNVGEPGPKFFSPSIDQIIPKAGYTPANCRFVLWAVNAFKGDATDADMLVVSESIVKKFSL